MFALSRRPQSSNLSIVKSSVLPYTALAALLLATGARAEKLSLVGGTIINPADGKTIENAVLLIDGEKIESVASRREAGVPVGSKWIDCEGKFILPGYMDTHVHFFQSGDLFTRPDVIGTRSRG